MKTRKQRFTSKDTSINKVKLPAVYKKVCFADVDTVLDYGCGKYLEHIKAALPEGTQYLPFDTYNQPDDANVASLEKLERAISAGKNVAVVCSNVLNVIDSDDVIRDIAEKIMDIVARSNGAAYVTVYEGNRSGTGRQTGPDSWQRNERTAEYLDYFPGYSIKNGVICCNRH